MNISDIVDEWEERRPPEFRMKVIDISSSPSLTQRFELGGKLGLKRYKSALLTRDCF